MLVKKKRCTCTCVCVQVQVCVHARGGPSGCQALLSCFPLYLLRQDLFLKSELTESAYPSISVCPRSLLSERWDYRPSPCLPGIYIGPGDANSCPHACGADTEPTDPPHKLQCDISVHACSLCAGLVGWLCFLSHIIVLWLERSSSTTLTSHKVNIFSWAIIPI